MFFFEHCPDQVLKNFLPPLLLSYKTNNMKACTYLSWNFQITNSYRIHEMTNYNKNYDDKKLLERGVTFLSKNTIKADQPIFTNDRFLDFCLKLNRSRL